MKRQLFLLLIFLSACGKQTETIKSLVYMPDKHLLEQGVVAKFYKHSDKAKGGQKKTDIGYRIYQLEGETLSQFDYNAEFAPTYESQINVAGGQWATIKEVSITPGTNLQQNSLSTAYTLMDSIQQNWNGQTAKKSKSISQYNWTSNIIDHQNSKKDTVYEDRKAVVFDGVRDYTRIINQDTISNEYNWKKVYAEGLGLVYFETKSSEYKYMWELAELMTLTEYETRKNHNTHRVGWIDTTTVLDKGSVFKTCYHFDRINDYYNDKRATFPGKKGALRALLDNQLDKKLLENESGYFTYRFVVNCKGEAGWFTTEEAGLDYARKKFNTNLRTHLFNILKEVKDWDYLTIRGEARDAYVYITFKIANGEIIEILP